MFNNYIKKILPIPITDIQISPKDNYVYYITTYSSVLNERGVCSCLEKRLKRNKKIENFDGWWFKDGDTFYKQAIITFRHSPI